MNGPKLLFFYKKEKDPKKKERILAIYKLTVEHRGITHVANMFLKSYNTIKNWLSRYKKSGINGLGNRPRPGRPKIYQNSLITDFVESQVGQAASVKEIRGGIIEQSGIDYPEHTIRRILHQEDYTPKVSQPVHVNKASPEDIEKWKRRIFPWASRAENDGFTFVVADETIIQNDHKKRRNKWSKRSKSIYETYVGDHQNGVMFGALAGDGTQMFCRMEWFRTEDAIECIEALLRKYGKVALLIDKAPQHRSRAMEQYKRDNRHRLRVAYFPVGCPELNAVELCWHVVKSAPYAHKYYSSKKKRMDAAMEFARTHRFGYDIRKIMRRTPVAII